MKEFGEIVKGLRIKRGLSLESVADQIGVTKGYVSQIERRKTGNPTLQVMLKFADLYDVPLDYLADRERPGVSYDVAMDINEERYERHKTERYNAILQKQVQELTGKLEEIQTEKIQMRDEMAVLKLEREKRNGKVDRLLHALRKAREAEQNNSEYLRKAILELGGGSK